MLPNVAAGARSADVVFVHTESLTFSVLASPWVVGYDLPNFSGDPTHFFVRFRTRLEMGLQESLVLGLFERIGATITSSRARSIFSIKRSDPLAATTSVALSKVWHNLNPNSLWRHLDVLEVLEGPFAHVYK